MSTHVTKCNQAVKRKQPKGSGGRLPPKLPPSKDPRSSTCDVGTDDCKRSVNGGAAARLPPATNVHQTNALWRRVRTHKAMSQGRPSCQGPTKASKARERNSRRGQQLHTPSKSSDTVTTTTGSQSDSQASKTRGRRVTDRDFRTLTLPAHGIFVLDDTKHLSAPTAYQHFDVEAPSGPSKEDVVKWYQGDAKNDSTVWLSLDTEDAAYWARVYLRLRHDDTTEARYSYYGKTAFLQMDVLEFHVPLEQKRTTYNTMEWMPKPDGEHLCCPPVLNDQVNGLSYTRRFAFENQPDLTFWLPLQLFRAEYRDKVIAATYVLDKTDVTAPYFTVEFKKTNEGLEAAVNGLAAAAALALYNRVMLRASRLLKNKIPEICSSWSTKQFSEIKHYGIAFNDNCAHVYEAIPNQPDSSTTWDSDTQPSQAWAGCTLYRRAIVKIESAAKVLELREWINEIHSWGLGKYADGVSYDIRGMLYQSGLRACSSLTQDEIERLPY